MQLISRIAPVLLALGALYLIETATQITFEAPRAVDGIDSAEIAKRRLVMVFVDSLSTADMVDASRMPRFKARLDGALHGPTRQCADGISLPCFAAIQTGVDRFSLFAFLRNFGGADGLPTGSVLAALSKRGVRVGYLGDPELSVGGLAYLETFTASEADPLPSDGRQIARGLEAMAKHDLRLVVMHITSLDTISHKVDPNGPEYIAEMEKVDQSIEAMWSQLRPDDHVMIFGDHGHDVDGRHFAGLDVPTYAAFFGAAFRPLETPLALTDHAAHIARVFGLEYAVSDRMRAYYAGQPVPPTKGLPALRAGAADVSVALFVAAAVAAFLIAFPAPATNRWVIIGGVCLLVAVFAIGYGFPSLRPLLYYRSRAFNTGVAAATALGGALLAAPFLLRIRPIGAGGVRCLAGLLAGGALLLALPTVYKFGGFYVAAFGVLLAITVASVLAVRRREILRLGWLLGFAGVVYTLWNPAVRSFSVQWFSFYSEDLAGVILPTVLLLSTVALVAPTGLRERRWLAAAIGALVLSVAGPWLPPMLFLPLCVLALPSLIAAHRRMEWAPVALLITVPALAFFFSFDAQRIAPMAAAVCAWSLWARARLGVDDEASAIRVSRAFELLLLVWMSYWATTGTRAGGLDFQYFFQWLPEGARVEESWIENGLMTSAKYLAVILLGMLLARRAAPGQVLPAALGAWRVGRLKLAGTVLFAIGFSAVVPRPGPYLTADVLQEAALWTSILLALALLPLGTVTSAEAALFEPRGN